MRFTQGQESEERKRNIHYIHLSFMFLLDVQNEIKYSVSLQQTDNTLAYHLLSILHDKE